MQGCLSASAPPSFPSGLSHLSYLYMHRVALISFLFFVCFALLAANQQQVAKAFRRAALVAYKPVTQHLESTVSLSALEQLHLPIKRMAAGPPH